MSREEIRAAVATLERHGINVLQRSICGIQMEQKTFAVFLALLCAEDVLDDAEIEFLTNPSPYPTETGITKAAIFRIRKYLGAKHYHVIETIQKCGYKINDRAFSKLVKKSA